MLKTISFLLAAMVTVSAAAQNAARPDPADSRASVSAPPYESALKDYRPFVETEVARWREVNAEVGRLGGHVGHVPRETGATTKSGAKPSAPTANGGRK